MSAVKFYLDIEVSRDGEPDEGRWYSWSNIVAEGNSLEECLDSASIGKIDQDGGDFGEQRADLPWMHDMIVEAFNAKYGKEMHDDGTLGMADRNWAGMEDTIVHVDEDYGKDR